MYIIRLTILLPLLHTSNKYVVDGKLFHGFQVILDGGYKCIFSVVVFGRKGPAVYGMKPSYPHSMVRLHPIAQVQTFASEAHANEAC